VAEREVVPFAGARIVAVNKVDRLRGRAAVPQLAAASELAAFDHVMPVSARTGTGVPELLAVLRTIAPEGPALFPDGQSSDQPLEQMVADVVREKVLGLTREEVPHSVAVVTEEVERDERTGFLTVSCTILVERESQKGIVIGRGGRTLKEVGSAARAELEATLAARMHLDLRVRVLKDWQRDPRSLDRLGL
jgi:GTP-binding protein Era